MKDDSAMSDNAPAMSREHLLFVTGELAESAVRTTAAQVAQVVGFDFTVQVLPITVAALMTSKWVLRKLQVPSQATRIIMPGILADDIESLRAALPIPVDCGPRDIRDLPEFFGKKREIASDYGEYRIEIIAEINHAPRIPIEELIKRAECLIAEGANIIDLGCSPGRTWHDVDVAVRELISRDIRVSIDSFDSHEVNAACRAGAELVLSVNSSNRAQAVDWNAEVVIIPDHPHDEKFFSETIEFLSARGVRMRLDPILEPIGCGFAESLERYANCRKRYPELPMMMGIGNITELTDVDSAGANVVLLGICEELQIESVLTTNVINWARSSVRECDVGRRLVHYACRHRVPPKRLDDRLVQLRDPKVKEFPRHVIDEVAKTVRDYNARIFLHDGEIHFVTRDLHLHATDPFVIMQQVLASPIGFRFDPSHAFYLGYEMCKAVTALTLNKQYEQDEALRWGMLTRDEKTHRISSRRTTPYPDDYPGLRPHLGEKKDIE
ncbi:MAG: DUF6513 domain-containing protein [Pirellulales bacterium]